MTRRGITTKSSFRHSVRPDDQQYETIYIFYYTQYTFIVHKKIIYKSF